MSQENESQQNEAQQKAAALQQEVNAFIAENLSQELVDGAHSDLVSVESWGHAGIRPCTSAAG